MSFRLGLAVVICALLGLALTSSASAAPAQVTMTRQCDVIESGTVCVSDHVVSTFQRTPSGTEVIIGNSRFDITFTAAPTSGTCSFAQSGSEHFHAVFRPTGGSSSGDLMRQEFRFQAACDGGPITVCETVLHFQQVNGVLVFQRSSAECTEEPTT